MAIFTRGDVVKARLSPSRSAADASDSSEPALVVSPTDLEDTHGLLWVVPIVGADAEPWPDDVAIVDLPVAGLPSRSAVRSARIMTIAAADANRVGRVSGPLLGRVLGHVTGALGRLYPCHRFT